MTGPRPNQSRSLRRLAWFRRSCSCPRSTRGSYSPTNSSPLSRSNSTKSARRFSSVAGDVRTPTPTSRSSVERKAIMPSSRQAPGRWYPTEQQLGTPKDVHTAFWQLLEQHYALQDQVTKLTAQAQKPAGGATDSPPPGSGPTDSMICGLLVQPVDSKNLANGA